MLCDKCKKNPATIHMQQFVLGAKTELHYCQECAFSFGHPDIPFPLENMFKGVLEQMQGKLFNPALGPQPNTAAPVMVCKSCGMTGEELKKYGKLGCMVCYQSFANEVTLILKNVQSSTRHEGKFPKRVGQEMLTRRQASDLRLQLQEAVRSENYELAAKLRDEIRSLEAT